MALQIISPGVQATLQGAVRCGFRHQGVPWSGPADPLSHSLANVIVGNGADETALEITLGGFEARFEADTLIAVTGAPCKIVSSNGEVRPYVPLRISAGESIYLAYPSQGMRTYLAIAGGLHAQNFLGSYSTYLPANLGGYEGRALRAGDKILFAHNPTISEPNALPKHLYPVMGPDWVLSVIEAPEFEELDKVSQHQFYTSPFHISTRQNRMGVQLEGPQLKLNSSMTMKSVPVFAGTIQCPKEGKPFLLLADGQTTGGYPRLGQVALCDRHRLGQLRPGNRVHFRAVSPDEAKKMLNKKYIHLSDWNANIIL